MAWVAAKVLGSIPGLAQWVKGSDIAAAAAWIQSLAREFPYAPVMAIKKKKKHLIEGPKELFFMEIKSVGIYYRN